jgi:threonine aldolase
MAEAEVGDDVYGDDPTVNRLEELGADMLGKEAAVFVPSGTFGNQLALFTWARRGTEVALGEECHIIQHEAGAASVIAGVQTRPVHAPDGVLSRAALETRLRRQGLHYPATSLICLENAHSLGKAVPLEALDEVKAIAGEWGVPVHLDGARIFNAATALAGGAPAEAELRKTARDIAARADSVMFCLSKGLCAPAGSLLAGPASFVREARLKRKVMGGGMRQAGILAAAGIIALREHPVLLQNDHRRAKVLAEKLSRLPGLEVMRDRNEIDMVFFRFPPADNPAKAAAIVEAFNKRGILASGPEGGFFRFVTHYWIGDAEIETIAGAAAEIFGGAL